MYRGGDVTEFGIHSNSILGDSTIEISTCSIIRHSDFGSTVYPIRDSVQFDIGKLAFEIPPFTPGNIRIELLYHDIQNSYNTV
jgi:hypothetical protein